MLSRISRARINMAFSMSIPVFCSTGAFTEPILRFLEEAHAEFGRLTGRYYGLVTQGP